MWLAIYLREALYSGRADRRTGESLFWNVKLNEDINTSEISSDRKIMSTVKKQQHYVWKNYFKPWTSNGQISCLRNQKVFQTSINNIAQEHFFYKSDSLNVEEYNLVKGIINYMHPTAHDSQFELLSIYLQTSSYDEYLKKCGLEDFHGIVEVNFMHVLENIYARDISFFKNERDKNDFSFFIGCQYSRTSKMRNNLINSFDRFNDFPSKEKISPEKISKPLQMIFGNTIGNWVYSKSKLCLLLNNSSANFITGDQPVINIKSDPLDLITPPQKIELYFPITPKLALLMTDDNKEEIQDLSEYEIFQFNDLMKNHSREQLYALNKSDFNPYM